MHGGLIIRNTVSTQTLACKVQRTVQISLSCRLAERQPQMSDRLAAVSEE
jgi:hypothetical protein